MKINAYILAADPAWIESSVLSYYSSVERIVVSFDQDGRGWTGAPIRVDECLRRLKAIDTAGKMQFVPGRYARTGHSPIDNDTFQRQEALRHASEGADWVLQLDTDEIVGNADALIDRLADEVPREFAAVDWPMRTFFQRLPDGRFLEVCTLLRGPVGSYPGPIAVRPGTLLRHARQTDAPVFRYDMRSRDTDPAAGSRVVHRVIDESAAILHMSWVRSRAEIEGKLQAWGHSKDFDWRRYVDEVWEAAPRKWWRMFRFHPMVGRWWPALRPVDVARAHPAVTKEVA
jgi:hypothetical protein